MKNQQKQKSEKKATKEISGGLIGVLALVIILFIGLMTFASPFLHKAHIMDNSSIEYNTGEKQFSVKYLIEARKGRAVISRRMDDGTGNPRITEGPVERDRYLSIYGLIEDMKENGTGPHRILLQLNGKSTSKAVSNTVFWDTKFRLLSQEYCKIVKEDGKSPGSLISAGVDPSGRIGVTSRLGAVFFNDEKGGLNVYLMRNSQIYPLGRDIFIATNFEGLGLAVLKGSDLYFWERKNLQNRQITLAEPWTDRPERRKVIVANDSVYYYTPGSNGLFDIRRYDYVNRKINDVLKNTDAFLLDATADGRHILVEDPGDPAICRTYDGTSGDLIGTKTQFLPPPPWKAFGFHKGPVEIIVYNSDKIELRSLNRDGTPSVRAIGAHIKNPSPVVFNHNRTRLLLRTPDNSYHVYDFKSDKSAVLNRTPLIMINPRFTEDGESIIYQRFDEIRQMKINMDQR